LNGYDGCVILVSHDPHLVEAVADQLLLVKDGAVTPYNDDLEAYRKLVIEQRRKERSDAKKESKEKKNKKSQGTAPVNALKAEKNLDKWSSEKSLLEQEMALPKALDNPRVMNQLLEKYTVVLSELEAAEADWLMAQEA
jgi:ATP-binding cassette subfamily F protein 3